MKIRTKLTSQYALLTAVIYLLTMWGIYLFSEHGRSESFYRNLKKEAVTKAHLFLTGKVLPSTMQSVYENNKNFIDEVEVAVYRPPFVMLYHDEIKNDIVKETAVMIQDIIDNHYIQFNEGHYQAIGLVYTFEGIDYIVTAAAYDGFGYSNLHSLKNILLCFSLLGLSIIWIVGYLLANSALSPVKEIVRKVKTISANNIEERLPVGTNHDELGELSTAFNVLLQDLQQAFYAQKMFVSNVSHELRTPMAALIAEAELTLLKPRAQERYVSALNNILLDSKRLISLIEGLLNLAKADFNPSQIKMEEVRLDELLMDAMTTVMHAHSSYHIELLFDTESEDDTLITVHGNRYLLTHAFINLMENNCKFSSNETSVVQIGFWENLSILRFSDTGIGIAEEDRQQLFTPFYRGGNSSFTAGHGIGLALVQKIITLHKGTIEVHSEVGAGTTFTIKLTHI